MKVFFKTLVTLVPVAAVSVAAPFGVACGRAPAPEAPVPEAPAAPAAGASEAAGGVAAALRLVREEYRDAVRDGAVVDATEYEETRIFLERAQARWKEARPAVEAADAAAAATVDRVLERLAEIVEAKGPVEEEEALVAEALEALAPHVPLLAEVAALRAAVGRTDAAIAASGGERVALDYRIGLVVRPPAVLYPPGAEPGSLEVASATHLLAVVLREARTKRDLPGARVVVSVDGDAPVEAVPFWDADLGPGYGRNVTLEPGRRTIEVRIEGRPAVRVARHGDMLDRFIEPASARFDVEVGEDGSVRGGAAPPTPLPADVRLGADLEMATSEAGHLVEAGPYRVGFISEAAEPYWLVEGETLVLRAARPGENRHLEAVVLEAATGRSVQTAAVRLVLEPASGGPARTVPLHPLWSAFAHHGATLEVAPGLYRVTVEIEPPPERRLDPSVLAAPARAAFDLRVPPPSEA